VATCSKIVDTISIDCKNFGSMLQYGCTQWAAQNIKTCAQWAQSTSKHCTSWKKCHWYTPWNCIAGFFCRAFLRIPGDGDKHSELSAIAIPK
jgi:hypothetical protein